MAVLVLPLGYTMLGLQWDKVLEMYNALPRKSSQSDISINVRALCRDIATLK